MAECGAGGGRWCCGRGRLTGIERSRVEVRDGSTSADHTKGAVISMRRQTLLFPRIRSLLVPRLVPPLVAVLLVFSFAGCLATNVNVRSDGTDDGAGVLVRVFADTDAEKAQRTEASGTLVELFSLDQRGNETFLQRSLAGEWGVSQIASGKYRLRVVAVLDAGGNIHETRSGDRKTDFSVKQGQTAEVKIILKKTPAGLIVAASVTVIVLVVALAVVMGKKDIHPPRPGAVLSHLPPPLLHHVIVAPEIWIGPVDGSVRRERSAPPKVTSVLPEPGSVVAARRVMPTMTLSQPIDEARIGRATIMMLGSKSGMIPGTTTVHRGLLRFAPSLDLLPGETVTVTVRADGVVNPDGIRLESDFSWSFQASE